MNADSMVRPGPIKDRDSADFWAGVADGVVRLQECAECDRRRFPPMASCPHCGSRGSRLVDLPGTGTVYSWIVARRAFDPVFADDIPYVVASVDFDDGARIALRIDDADHVDFGLRVRATVVHHDDWSELRVVPD